jgi:hypothetical protein
MDYSKSLISRFMTNRVGYRVPDEAEDECSTGLRCVSLMNVTVSARLSLQRFKGAAISTASLEAWIAILRH